MGMTIEKLVAENDKLKRQLAYESTALTMMRADYNARLKADMVAMLTELQLEIEEWSIPENAQNKNRVVYIKRVDEIIQQKIKALKAEMGAEE